MKMSLWLMCAVMAALGTGCGGEKLAEVSRQAKRNEERLDRLEKMQQEILAAIEASRKESAAALDKQVADLVSKKFDERIQGDIAKVIDQKMGGGAPLQAVVQTVVNSAIADSDAKKKAEAEAREAERRQEWEQRRQEFENRRWADLQKEIGLNEQQTAKMREASQAVRDTIRQAFEGMREQPGGFNMDQARQQGEQLRQQYEAALSSILTPQQLEAYKKRPDSMLRMMSNMLDGGGHRGPPDHIPHE